MRVHAHLARAGRSQSEFFPADALDRISTELARAAAAREAQLAALPPVTTLVAAAHRDSVLRILTAIHRAQEQLAEGSYGDCQRCRRPADLDLALSRPWVPLCGACGSR